MTVFEHRPTQPEDARNLVARLRGADKLELLLAHGPDILKHLEDSVKASDKACYTVFINGTSVAIYGLASSPHFDFNVPWMLGTEEVMRHPRKLVRWGRATLRYWADRYDRPLKNLVLAVNDKHVNWLKHIGCTFGRTVKLGPLNSNFLEFDYV